MDADIRRMMADLGLARRDEVSAPEDLPKARQARVDYREQAKIAADFEGRRTKIENEALKGKDERTAKMKAWHTPSAIEADEVTAQLENRWSGQGHRAALKQQRLNEPDKWEALDARVGEERRLYLQQRAGNSSPAILSSPRKGKDEQRPANHTRAPSPRRFGTVRFNPGRPKIVSTNGKTTSGSSCGKAAVRLTPTRAVDSAQATPTSSIKRPACVKAASSVSLSPPRKVTVPVSQRSVPQSASKPTIMRSIRDRVLFSRALVYAATPDTCNKMLMDDPDVQPFIGDARDRLIKEAIGLARDSDEIDIAVYGGTHPERIWMIQAASKAKAQVEDETDDQILQYCKMHARHMPFVRAALSAFAANRDPTFTLSSANGARNERPCSSSTNTAETPKTDINKPTVAINPSKSNHPDDTNTAETPKAGINEPTAAIDPFKATSPTKIAVLNPAESPNDKTNQSPSQSTTKSSANDSVGQDNSMNGSASTAASTPLRLETNGIVTGRSVSATLGTLVATFFNAAGQFLGHHHVGVAAPIQANISIVSRDPAYNPRQLIGSIDAMANSMVRCSNGMDGVRLTEDGLWAENDQL